MARCRLDPNALAWSAEPMATDTSEYDKAMPSVAARLAKVERAVDRTRATHVGQPFAVVHREACVQQAERQMPLLLVYHVVGDSCPAASVGLARPRTRQIQLPSKGREAVSVAAWTLTATWQSARLPTAPQYWRATPTDALPYLGNDTSSITHISGLTTSDSRSAIRCPDRQRILRRLVHELLQGLHVPVRLTLGHRLDRLTPAIQHQPP